MAETAARRRAQDSVRRAGLGDSLRAVVDSTAADSIAARLRPRARAFVPRPRPDSARDTAKVRRDTIRRDTTRRDTTRRDTLLTPSRMP